jgi:methanogenic corrinoid protein MtbC1
MRDHVSATGVPFNETAAEASEAILSRRHAIAQAAVEHEFARRADASGQGGTRAREKSLQDALHHLAFLAQSLALDSAVFFDDYLAWVKVVLARRGGGDLAVELHCLGDAVQDHLAPGHAKAAARMIQAGVARLPEMPDDVPTFIDAARPHGALARRYLEALLRADRGQAAREIHDALAAGVPLEAVYLDVFAASQREVGRLWQVNEISVAQEHFCTAATQLIMSQSWPAIPRGPRRGTLVAACVEGDLHELGLRMVADFFEMAGWQTLYLGANTPHRGVAETVVASHAGVLAISASIGFHVGAVEELIAEVRATPGCERVRVLVGGHPFNVDSTLWRRVGADAHAADAKAAIAFAASLDGELA